MSSPTVLVAAAVVEKDGRLLLTRRPKGSHLEDLWEFPGGKVEPGEDPRDTVVRECREECAIELQAGDILDVTFHRYATKSVLLMFFACKWLGGDVQHLGVSEHAWVTPEELDDYDLPPADVPLVRKLQGKAQ